MEKVVFIFLNTMKFMPIIVVSTKLFLKEYRQR